MNTKKKSLEDWNQTGGKPLDEYLCVGDIVSDDLVDYFLDVLPPLRWNGGYLQCCEQQCYKYNSSGELKPTYITFAKSEIGEWIYHGNCFLGEKSN